MKVMKKYLLTLPVLGACAFGIANVDAKNLDLVNQVDSNTYIIGNRVFELNNYYLTITDVVNAGIEYALMFGDNTAPVYYLYENADGAKGLMKIDGRNATEVALNDVYTDGIIDATMLNGKIFDGIVISSIGNKVEDTVKNINSNAAAYGLNSMTFVHDSQTWMNTITANVSDLNKDLMDYTGVKDLFTTILTEARNGGVRRVTIAGQDIRLDDSTNVLKETYKVLSGLISEDQDLVLGSLVGKEVSIDVHYEGDGAEADEYYKIVFNYNLDIEKDKNINKVINKINNGLANNPGYGVESIAYDNASNTATVKLSGNADLLENQDAIEAKIDELIARYETQIDAMLSDVANMTVSVNGLTLTIDENITEKQINKFMSDLYFEISDENGEVSSEQVKNLNINVNVGYIIDDAITAVDYIINFEI